MAMPAPTKYSVMAAPAANFQQDLQAAFAQQRRAHEDSLKSFFSTVAMLCDQPEATGPFIAEQLREFAMVSHAPHLPGGDMDPEVSCNALHDVAPLRSHYPLQKDVVRSAGTFEGSEADSIMTEHQIKHLAFMDESGEIIEPPSPLERICGPGYATFKERLTSPFERCQPRTGRCAAIVDGIGFKILTTTVIVLNFVFIIVQSNYKASHLNQDESSTMVAIGYSFTAFYVFELCVLMFFHGKEFFVGPEMAWNFFDTVIVLVAILDLMMQWLGLTGFNMSFLRVLRFFKISRVLRMFSALRSFKEIRIMVDALVGCLTIFLFCMCLMLIFLSVFAIFFVQGATELLEDGVNLDVGLVADLRANWCSVSDAMLQLFMAVTGGNDWESVYNIVREIGGMHAVLFLFFVGFYYFAFFNVITSVFCEKAMSLAAPTQCELIAKRIQKEHRDALGLKSLLKKSLGASADHAIDAQQVADFVNDPEVELFFNVRGLKSCSAHKLYRMLCEVHGTDKIQIGEFISSLVKLDGAANSIDAHCLQVRQSHGLNQMKGIQKEQSKEIAFLRDILEDVHQPRPVAPSVLPKEGEEVVQRERRTGELPALPKHAMAKIQQKMPIEVFCEAKVSSELGHRPATPTLVLVDDGGFLTPDSSDTESTWDGKPRYETAI